MNMLKNLVNEMEICGDLINNITASNVPIQLLDSEHVKKTDVGYLLVWTTNNLYFVDQECNKLFIGIPLNILDKWKTTNVQSIHIDFNPEIHRSNLFKNWHHFTCTMCLSSNMKESMFSKCCKCNEWICPECRDGETNCCSQVECDK